jgi:hypothetical protein
MTVLNMINGYMPLKPSSVGNLDILLGAKLRQTQLAHGILAWGLSPSKYVAQAVKNCEKHLTNKLNSIFWLPQRADNPFPYDYCLESDLSNPLDPECSSFYLHLIGVMRWMVELGPIDIATKVSLLLSHLAYPCKGHLETALHMMACLQQKHNTWLVFDPTYPKINMDSFPQFDLTKFYGDIERLSLFTCLSPCIETLMTAWCVKVTMQGANVPDALALVFLSSVIWLWLTGFPRNKQPLIPLFLVPNLLLCSTKLRSCKDFDLNFAWWEFHWPNPLLSMLTISCKWPTQLDLSWPWKRNVTPSATMQCKNQLLWANH